MVSRTNGMGMGMSQGALFPSLAPAGPFVKWPGGKRGLIEQYAPYLPRPGTVKRYVAPFVGGGAVFFYLRPEAAALGDANGELVNAYQMVKEEVGQVLNRLRAMEQEYHGKRTMAEREVMYYEVRDRPEWVRDDLEPAWKAARFLFLNKTGYNGLYRVNGDGKFNVPFGKRARPTICDEEWVRRASRRLQAATIRQADFGETAEQAQPGDVVFMDPPYVETWTGYTAGGFSTEDQARVAQTFRQLAARGCRVFLSNSDTPLVRELYRGFEVVEIQARRAINRDGDGRGPVTELLVIGESA